MKGPLIVTGCQRSGTAFVARALSQDYNIEVLGHRDFMPDEEGFKVLETLIVNDVSDFIIQMPTALQCFVELYHLLPNVHFIGVLRDTEDIIESMKRIRWRIDAVYHWPDYMYDHICMMKGNWELLKQILPNTAWTEVNYTDFEEHSLFIPKEQRKEFHCNQWSPNKPIGPRFFSKNDIIF